MTSNADYGAGSEYVIFRRSDFEQWVRSFGNAWTPQMDDALYAIEVKNHGPTDWQAFAADYLSDDPERLRARLPEYLRPPPPNDGL